VNRYAAPLLAKREVFMDLVFEPAEELQIDWGQAEVILDGQRTVVHVFCARCRPSKASFSRAYLHEDQLSFLDGHDHAIRFFGFLHKRYCYDNLSAAVISRPGPKSKRDEQAKRVLTEPFRKLRSHYRMFNVRFCTPASGNEKGHAENLVKYTQRTLLCPQPSCPELETLNEQLMARCQADLSKETDGTTRQALLASYAESMAEGVPEPYRASKSLSTIASKFSCVRYDNCQYSVPVAFAHQPCVVRCYASTVTVASGGRKIAEHPRAGVDESYVLDFKHYLDHLERKKGWLGNGRAFRPDNLPVALRRFRCELLQKFGHEGLRRLVEVLLLYRTYSSTVVDAALTSCLARGVIHEAAVLQTLTVPCAPARQEQSVHIAADSVLAVTEREGRDPADYDVVLTRRAS
jgi:hypothetical protein